MAERLRSKPGSDAVAVTVGDMTTTVVPGSLSHVYIVANSIMNVTTKQEQVAVFANAAAHFSAAGASSLSDRAEAATSPPRGIGARVHART